MSNNLPSSDVAHVSPSPLTQAAVLGVIVFFTASATSEAKVYNCRSGDVTCLINAINAANATARPDTIRLTGGIYALKRADNTTDGPNGLPSITSKIEIRGKGSEQTVLQRDPSVDGELRIVHVAESGDLTLNGVAVKKGRGSDSLRTASGLFNRGIVRIFNSTVSENFAAFATGGVENAGSGTMVIVDSFITENMGVDGGISGGILNAGKMAISRSTIANNCGESSGGIANIAGGDLEITESSITQNSTHAFAGVGILNAGTLTITNTSVIENGVACNLALPFAAAAASLELAEASLDLIGGRAIYNIGGNVTINSSTIVRNIPSLQGRLSGGIFINEGTLELQNTILAENASSEVPGDCFTTGNGEIISLGNNLIGDPTGCDIDLLESDVTGEAGLGVFTDNGNAGNGHIPLLVSSRAINHGDDSSCPKRDQLGNKRKKPCDLGAVEFGNGRRN
jgi:hypothetical protein